MLGDNDNRFIVNDIVPEILNTLNTVSACTAKDIIRGKLDRTQRIFLDREISKVLRKFLLFKKNVIRDFNKETKVLQFIEKDGNTEYIWKIITPEATTEKDALQYGVLCFDVFISAILFAQAEKTETPIIPIDLTLDLFDMKKEGLNFERIRKCHETIFHMEYIIREPKSTARYHLYSTLYNKDGKGGYIRPRINKDAAKALFQHLQGEKPTHYLPYEKRFLGKGDIKSKSLAIHILSKSGLPPNRIYPITIKHLLGIINIKPKSYSKGISFALKTIEKAIKDVKEMGLIQEVEYIPPQEIIMFLKKIKAEGSESLLHKYGFRKWIEIKKNFTNSKLKVPKLTMANLLKWKMLLIPQKKQIELFREPEDKQKNEDYEKDEDFKNWMKQLVKSLPNYSAEQIAQWHMNPEFKTQKLFEEVLDQIINTINKYSSEMVSEIFYRTLQGPEPHPKDFWGRVKELKR